MAEEMTHSQALQELTRIENMWQAASKLKEALQVAASVEASVKRLQAEEERIGNVVLRAEGVKNEQLQQFKDEVDKAAVTSRQRLQELDDLDKKRRQEYADQLAEAERNTNAAIARLTNKLRDKDREVGAQLIAIDKEIIGKKALVAELNEQLDNLRKRLG